MTSSEVSALGLPKALDAALDSVAKDALAPLRALALEKKFQWLEVHFASLPRRIAKTPLPSSLVDFGGSTFRVDLGGLRVVDAAATALLLAGGLSDAELRTLWDQGDQEERRMILRALPHLPDTPVRTELLEEAHRCNDGVLFEAAFCDRELASKLLDDLAFGNIVLKAAFLGLAHVRLLGWETRGTEDLSLKLLDFMAERNAAGRPIWGPSLEVCALAPVAELPQHVLTELGSASARRRLAAVRAAGQLGDAALIAAARKAKAAEQDPIVLEAIEAL